MAYHKPSTNRSTPSRSSSTNRSTPSRSSSTTTQNTVKKEKVAPIKKEEVAPEGSLKYYQNKISENKAKIELSIDPKERVKLQKEIDGYKFEINRINFNDGAPDKPCGGLCRC